MRKFLFILVFLLAGCGEDTYQDRQREKRLRKLDEQAEKLRDEQLNEKMHLNDWKNK